MDKPLNESLGSYKFWPDPNADLKSYGWHWKLQAESFRKAAGVLAIILNQEFNQGPRMGQISIGVSDPYILMIGFAIENLLKAILLHRHPELIQGDKLIGKHFSNHNLREVAKDAQITLTENEDRLCDICSIYIEGRGRYPIPKRTSKKIQQMHLNFRLISMTFNTLYGRLSDLMDQEKMLTMPGGKIFNEDMLK